MKLLIAAALAITATTAPAFAIDSEDLVRPISTNALVARDPKTFVGKTYATTEPMVCFRIAAEEYRCFRRLGPRTLIVASASIEQPELKDQIDRSCPTLARAYGSRRCLFGVTFKAREATTDQLETSNIYVTDRVSLKYSGPET